MHSYFSHDSNARNDTKILNLRMEYGAQGYGIYFMILERLRDDQTYSNSTNYNAIAYDLHEDKEIVKRVIEDFELFEFNEDHSRFYSKSFNERMSLKDAASKRRSEAGKKGAQNRWNGKRNSKNNNAISTVIAMPFKKNSNAIAKLTNCDSNSITLLRKKMANHSKRSKEKRSKEKKREVKGKDNKPSSSSSSIIKSVSDLYQENIAPISSLTAQNMQFAIDDFTEHGTSEQEAGDIVKKAIEITALNNIHSWKYIQSILNNWQNDNLYTLANIEAHEKNRNGSSIKPKNKNLTYEPLF